MHCLEAGAVHALFPLGAAELCRLCHKRYHAFVCPQLRVAHGTCSTGPLWRDMCLIRSIRARMLWLFSKRVDSLCLALLPCRREVGKTATRLLGFAVGCGAGLGSVVWGTGAERANFSTACAHSPLFHVLGMGHFNMFYAALPFRLAPKIPLE